MVAMLCFDFLVIEFSRENKALDEKICLLEIHAENFKIPVPFSVTLNNLLKVDNYSKPVSSIIDSKKCFLPSFGLFCALFLANEFC